MRNQQKHHHYTYALHTNNRQENQESYKLSEVESHYDDR